MLGVIIYEIEHVMHRITWLSLGLGVLILGGACTTSVEDAPVLPTSASPIPTTTLLESVLSLEAIPTVVGIAELAERAGLDLPPSETGEWPFVAERPEGSEMIPLEAASFVLMSKFQRDYDDLLDIRTELDPELQALRALYEGGSITGEQDDRRRELLYRYTYIDDFLQGLEEHLLGGFSAALTKVAGFLDLGVWTIEYQGDGLWIVHTGTGAWQLDEPGDHIGPLDPELWVRPPAFLPPA